jgi:cytochrome c-type biogenesis protein
MTLPLDLGLTAVLVALAAGAASFLSPCVLPLLPAYLSFVSGLTVDEVEKGDRRVLWSTIGFVAGFSLVFTLLGAGFSLMGQLMPSQRVLEIAAGALLVIMGVVIAGVTAPSFMQRDVRPLLSKAPRGPAGAVVVGIAFALGWTPCVGPVLASILAMAASQSDPAGGAFLLFVYSLGLGIPFLLAGLFVGKALRTFARVRRHLRTIQIVCGVLLVVYGALLIAGQFSRLSGWLPGWVVW